MEKRLNWLIQATKAEAYRIAVIPGDGIGGEVVPEGVRVLRPPQRDSASSSNSMSPILPVATI